MHACMLAGPNAWTHTHRKIAHVFPPLVSIRKEEIVLKARAAVAADQVVHKADHLKRQVMKAAVH